MPNRIVREGILTSERINALSPNAELFYRRLMSVVDDFGRFSANPTLLRATCYPLKLDSVKEDSIKKHLTECADAGLIVLYTVEAKMFLELQDFRQQMRAKESKYPPPDCRMRSGCVADDAHPIANAHLDVFGDGDEVDISSERLTHSEPVDEPSGFEIPLNDGSEHAVAARTLQEWANSFPAVDVEQELRSMRAWCLANRAKRKTKRGVESFIVRWLQKAQDSPAKNFSPKSDLVSGGI